MFPDGAIEPVEVVLEDQLTGTEGTYRKISGTASFDKRYLI